MTSFNSNNDSFSTDEQGVEIRPRHVEEGDVLAMTQTDAHSNGNVPNNTKGGLGSTALKVLGGTAALVAVGSASYGAGVNSTVAKMNGVTVTSQKASAGKSDKSKAGKKVCLEYGFVNDEVIKGQFPSENPLLGQTGGATGVCSADYLACVAAAGDPESQGCKDYQKCLVDAGAVVGPLWLNRDVKNGEAYFTADALCGRITATAINSRTRFELWDDNINEPLSRYREFKVDYDIKSTGGNDGYINLYVRVDSTRTTYFDCNFVFNTDGNVGSGQILINLDTPSNSARTCTSAGCTGGATADTTGCVNGNSLQDYITANSGAVMGVGNGETYTHVLNTGSTGQNNQGSDVCWKDAVFTRVDENDVQIIDQYEFTLN